jgi:hypothetical protein
MEQQWVLHPLPLVMPTHTWLIGLAVQNHSGLALEYS